MATYICSKACIVDVHKSHAGYYIGVVDDEGPRCRISGSYKTQAEADMALLYGTYDRIADEIAFCGPCFVEEEFLDPDDDCCDDYDEPDWEDEYGFQFTKEKKLAIIAILQQMVLSEEQVVPDNLMRRFISIALFGERETDEDFEYGNREREPLITAIVDHLHLTHCMTYNVVKRGFHVAPVILNFRK